MPHKKSKDAKQGESKVHPFIGNEEISERTECIRCRRKQTGCRHDVCFRMRTDSRKPSWMAMQGNIPAKELLEAEGDDIRKASFLKNPQDVLAVFKRPDWSLDEADPSTSLVLALDGIQDPGNLGTIIRLADWFGIEHIVCSPDTADVFSPKTVQATMGALAHVKVHYTELEDYLKAQAARQIPLFGTFLDGENMYTKELSANGIIVMGNEGNGIRPQIEKLINQKLYIPSFPPERETSESLNVAIATAVICAEFRRCQGNAAQ